MKNKANNKPTMKEVSNAIGNLIQESYRMSDFLRRLDSTLAAYIEYNGDAPKFKEWLQNEIKKEEERNNESNSKDSGKSNGGDTKTKVTSIKSGKKEPTPTT
tara:strand:- start:1149 stop:1454 length:306 start_codon:yes stop_codon:yes gene_type:complete